VNAVQREINSGDDGSPTAARWVAIIDDHDSLRASLVRALRIEGIRAEGFASAESYLDREASPEPVCLVLDMQLPRMSGHELMHLLERERPPLPPTVVITGHETMLSALDGCCRPYGRLHKPFPVEVLLELLAPLAF
jgi:FixJ family two-component response regulator